MPDTALILEDLVFRGLTKETLLREERSLKLIVTVNVEAIALARKNARLRAILNDNYACFDGQIPYLLARFRIPSLRFEKLSGSDLIHDFSEVARDRGKAMFLLGGSPEANRLAVRVLRDRDGTYVEGYAPVHAPYPLPEGVNREILRRVEAVRPCVLLVAFGIPKQEYWVDDHRRALEASGIRWAIGVGGTFDMVAGLERRAPKAIRRAGLEWLWRALLNPRRLGRLVRSVSALPYILGADARPVSLESDG